MDRAQDIPIIYENGVFRPEGAVNLPEGTRAFAYVPETASGWTPEIGRKAMEEIKRIGDSGVFNSGGRKLTRDEMHERH